MSAPLQMPPPLRQRPHPIPSHRNRQVYERVVIDQRSQEEVAREFGITQQRVSQIAREFTQWLQENLPAEARELPAAEQLSLAVNVTYLRYEQAQTLAVRSFEASRRDKLQKKERLDKNGELLWTERQRGTQSGKLGYLNAYVRAAEKCLKLVQMAGGLIKVMDQAGDGEEPQPSDLAEEAKAWLDLPSEKAATPEEAIADHSGQPAASEAAADAAPVIPLWNSAERKPDPSPVALRAEAETSADETLSDAAARRKSFLQGAKIFLPNPCETRPLVPDSLAAALSAPVPLSADERRRDKKQRYKHLARLQAACKTG